MWHPFWQNRLTKLLVILKLGAVFLAPVSIAQESESAGILQSLQEIVANEQNREDNLFVELSGRQINIERLRQIQNFVIAPEFLRSILLHSNQQYLKWAADHRCRFYALLDNGLLVSSAGEIQNIPIVHLNAQGEKEISVVTRSDFIRHTNRDECFRNRELKELFTIDNLSSTLNSIDFTVPQNEAQCLQIHTQWLNNAKLPYLCHIPEQKNKIEEYQLLLGQLPNHQVALRRYYREQIQRVEHFLGGIDNFQKIYLQSLCENLFSPEKFCARYLADDVWTRILNQEAPEYKMSYHCAEFLNKSVTELNDNDFNGCAIEFNQNPEICHDLRNRSFPSFRPRPSCRIQSQALMKSRLRTPYKDCPGRVDNEGMINAHRLITHFTQREIETRTASCASEINFSVANLYIQSNREEVWPMYACFQSPVTRSEECMRYIPGHHPTSEMAETRVIASILRQIRSTPRDLSCQMIEKSRYRPQLLEFQTGCHILFDPQNCTLNKCPKRILYNQNEITEITYRGRPHFHYFPLSHTQQATSFVRIFEEVHELRSRSISNLTELRTFLNQFEHGVVHGVGCLESLRPDIFFQTGLNSCRPMPFIIDGIIEDDLDVYLSFRSAIDDINSPSLISWNHLFNALSSYSQLHPIRTWTLYGIH